MPPDFQEPYTYPGTNVLKNKPGIRDPEKLKNFEFEQVALRSAELHNKPIKGRFDLAHMQAIHKHLFQDVYDWAGDVRRVDISKGGSMFARKDFIEPEAKRLSSSLSKEQNLKGMDKPEFVDRLAYYYGELNALHPFREGNGRTTREFIGQLAREAGYEFDQTRITNKDQWNEAARRSFGGEMEPIKQVFEGSIRYGRAVAFEKLPEGEAVKKHPELAPVYGLMRALEAKAEVDGLTPAQRAIVATQVRQSVAHQVERGEIPEVKLREIKRVEADKSPSPER